MPVPHGRIPPSRKLIFTHTPSPCSSYICSVPGIMESTKDVCKSEDAIYTWNVNLSGVYVLYLHTHFMLVTQWIHSCLVFLQSWFNWDFKNSTHFMFMGSMFLPMCGSLSTTWEGKDWLWRFITFPHRWRVKVSSNTFPELFPLWNLPLRGIQNFWKPTCEDVGHKGWYVLSFDF